MGKAWKMVKDRWNRKMVKDRWKMVKDWWKMMKDRWKMAKDQSKIVMTLSLTRAVLGIQDIKVRKLSMFERLFEILFFW